MTWAGDPTPGGHSGEPPPDAFGSRRLAALVAAPLLFALFLAAYLIPLPYVIYSPGVTVDLLAERKGEEVVQVSGHKVYRDDGELRMTTIYLTQPDADINLFEVLAAWISDEQAVYPYDAVYQQGTTRQQSDEESAAQMVSSQDAATAAALDAMGYDVIDIEVIEVTKDSAADGKFRVHDVISRVDGKPVDSAQQVIDQVKAAGPGTPMRFTVLHDGERRIVKVAPREVDGDPIVGVTLAPRLDLPFEVSVNIDDGIGGPSAGLMFSLSIYDTLTPGSLTGGEIIAGTGTVDALGTVGPIGGIQQKIVAARDAGAELFLVPADNCGEALGAPRGDLRLVKVESTKDAITSLESWVDDHDADLPTCGRPS